LKHHHQQQQHVIVNNKNHELVSRHCIISMRLLQLRLGGGRGGRWSVILVVEVAGRAHGRGWWRLEREDNLMDGGTDGTFFDRKGDPDVGSSHAWPSILIQYRTR
jgi:hypothetical protein